MTFKCCICGRQINDEKEYGNNPYPFSLKNDDRCCNNCDNALVIPARVGQAFNKDINVDSIDALKDIMLDLVKSDTSDKRYVNALALSMLYRLANDYETLRQFVDNTIHKKGDE